MHILCTHVCTCMHACIHSKGCEQALISLCDRGLTMVTQVCLHTCVHIHQQTHVCAGRRAQPWRRCIEGTQGSLSKYTNLYPNTPGCQISSCGWRERSECETAKKVNTAKTKSTDKVNLNCGFQHFQLTNVVFHLPSSPSCRLQKVTSLGCNITKNTSLKWCRSEQDT